MLAYRIIEIYTSEEAHCGNKPVADAVIDYLRGLKIAARCVVSRGIAGCYESGEITTTRLEILSFNLPITISIIVPAAASKNVLEALGDLVTDGIIAVRDAQVVGHRTANTFFPRQLTVRDVMTRDPVKITAERSLADAAQLLLSSIFTGLPVVDERDRVIGVITQGDLVNRGGLPLRLGLLAETTTQEIAAVMTQLARRSVGEVMSRPAITVAEGLPLAEAVELMLTKDLKRLPVENTEGRLTGIISRLDVFRTVMRETPDWQAFCAQNIDVRQMRTVGDIVRRDTHTVLPDATVDTLLNIIGDNDIQRLAVVDADNRLLGIISDRDLLRYCKPDPDGLRYLLTRISRTLRGSGGPPNIAEHLQRTKAADIMTTEIVSVQEDLSLNQAITLMTEQRLKRLPVVDDHNRFLGMISRDSLLRTGYGGH